MYSAEYVTFRETVRMDILNEHGLGLTNDMIDDVLMSYDDFVSSPELFSSPSKDSWIRSEASRLYFQKMGSTPAGQRPNTKDMRVYNACVGAVCMITDRHASLQAMAA